MNNKKLKSLITLSLMFLGIIFSFHNQSVYANFEGYKETCVTTIDDTDDSEGENDNNSSGNSGSWEVEGTDAFKIAKEIWDYWKGKGFSGAAISGVLGNVAHEGGFEIPDRAEGHYGNDSKTNGIAYGNVPHVGSGYPTGSSGKPEGGGGHYQFTPYSKFAPLSDKKWLDSKAQSNFVWTSEVKNASWLKTYIYLDSVNEAVEKWFSLYERGASLDPAKITSGKKAYQVFGGAGIDGDSELANVDDDAEGDKETEDKDKSTFSVCDTGSKNSSGDSSDGEIEKLAKKLIGYFTYLQVHGEKYIGSVESPKKDGVTDCSGFVWLVLTQAGYNTPKDMQWFTQSMEDDAKGKGEYLKEIKASEAKAGDVVIVNTGNGSGSNGHTAILLEDWKEKESDPQNTTKIIQMGGISTATGVNESEFGMSFLSLVNGNNGKHTLTFARPVKN